MQKDLLILGHWFYPNLWSDNTKNSTNILTKVTYGSKTDWVITNKMEYEWLDRAKEALIYDIFDLDIHPEEMREFILGKKKGLYIRNIIDPLLFRHGYENIIYLGNRESLGNWIVSLAEDIKAKIGDDAFGEYFLARTGCGEGMPVREFLLWYKGADDEKYHGAIKEWSGIQDLDLAYRHLVNFFKACLRS